ncbi:serine hydrolase domain-containing protein [Micromonospora sp. NPDC049230]|uniref:serine hydrolase domain-containing protein n=1 Tax=Micromonospora sp. NPDC049230 TaxID=3155502 RepID=UPI0033EC1DDC
MLSRSYGMADREKGIRNHEGSAFSLSSAGKPFHAVAMLQLAQQRRVQLTDPVGRYLTGFTRDIAEQVTIHHMLAGNSGMNTPAEDYVQENIFRRCGMTGTAFSTRPQWLTDRHIAHPYMMLAGGSRVDAVRNLDKSSPYLAGKNPGRAFIDAPGDGGFATAPDLVRFAHAPGDGTVLNRPWADLLTAAKLPHGPASFGSYTIPVRIVNGQWMFARADGNPGVGASWSIYPYTGWVGVILSNSDGVPLKEMSQQEMRAVTGGSPGGGPGGGG